MWMWGWFGLFFVVLEKKTLAVPSTKGEVGRGRLVCLRCALNLCREILMFRSVSSPRWLNDLTDWTYGLD